MEWHRLCIACIHRIVGPSREKPVSLATLQTVMLKSDSAESPNFIYDPDFDRPDAEAVFAGEEPPELPASPPGEHMADDVTRDHTRRMHYAAYRVRQALTPEEAADWKHRYHLLRDLVVLGN